jgi:hypothetical protein
MSNIGGFGLVVTIKASVTFPLGLTVTQFADDADPFDLPSMQIADKSTGLNGDLITWPKATPIMVTLNMIPGSEDDKNLAVLYDANRVGKGKSSSYDVITMVGTYPDGKTVTVSNGVITDGMPGDSVSSAGRKKSKNYGFAFENVSRT